MDDLKEEFGTQTTDAMAYGKNISRSADTHMTEESFNRLVDDLGPYLCVDDVKSRNSTSGIQPVDKRFIVAAGLRWL
jgi:hypothetical protein